MKDMPLLMLDAYSAVGFRLNNGMRVFGPVAVFPTCVLSWLVPRGAAAITRESLSLFTLVHPKPEIVYVGVGNADEVGGLFCHSVPVMFGRNESRAGLRGQGLSAFCECGKGFLVF